MDLLKDNVRTLYLKYLGAALGSTLIMSIYSLVDTIAIGQYAGPPGTAAVATFFPLWSLIFAFGLLFGIGGSVLMAQSRGAGDKGEGDRYYTVAVAAAVATSAVILVVYGLFLRRLLGFFGAEGEVMELALAYTASIIRLVPLFLVGQTLVPLIRNDGHPAFTTLATVTGGVVNVLGDWFFVFVLDMGVAGAGVATSLGQAVAFSLLLSYLFQRRCNLRLDPGSLRDGALRRLVRIVFIGASSFVIDLAMGVMAVVFNRQTLALGGAASLAVWGMVSSIGTTIQTFGYATGESAQAIEAANYGAGRMDRVNACFRVSSVVAVVIGGVALAAAALFPEALARLYMDVDDEVLAVVPWAMRAYCLAFPLLVFNVSSTYYFQSVDRPGSATAVSLMRGFAVPATLAYALPAAFGPGAIWLAVPVGELVTCAFVVGQVAASHRAHNS